jgi:hypothetical protein
MAASSSTTYAPVGVTSPISPNFSRRRHSNGAADHSNPFDTGYTYQQDNETYAPLAGPGAEDHEMSPTWNPANLYSDADEPASPGSRGRASSRSRPPPSSFQFPFQCTFLFISQL